MEIYLTMNEKNVANRFTHLFVTHAIRLFHVGKICRYDNIRSYGIGLLCEAKRKYSYFLRFNGCPFPVLHKDFPWSNHVECNGCSDGYYIIDNMI